MKRLIVSVTNDLVTDQRVHKVCTTLSQLDYEILVIGRKLNRSIELNRNYKTFRFKLLFNKGFLFYAEYNIRLFLKLIFLRKDVLLANDLDTLLPNYLISKIFNKKLVYDSHELFTEVPELINRPLVKGFWLKIEKLILPRLKNCYTVSNSIANYYNSKYNLTFSVIKNYPFKLDLKTIKKNLIFSDNFKTVLYQGALNIGRGLELVIESIVYLDKTHLIIIGNGPLEIQLKEMVKDLSISGKVKFISSLEPEKLPEITYNCDLGISLEENLGLNYRYSLPNKIFDYIQGQTPILVSNLIEMRKIIETYGVGEIVSARNPKDLAHQITNILNLDKNYFNKNLEIARQKLVWENESKKLIEIFNNLE